MSIAPFPDSPVEIEYPDTDGQPLAVTTTHYDYISLIKGGLDVVFEDRADVLVAADLLWYPVEGHPEIRNAPDVLVALRRPRGERRSYQQWKEANQPPHVVFEIWSPGNTASEAVSKLLFYRRHGAAEYYFYDFSTGELGGCLRLNDKLEVIPEMEGWVSPALGIRFELEADTRALKLFRPDGTPFKTIQEVDRERVEAVARAEQEAARAEQEAARAEQEAARAEQEAARAERLAARLRAAGIDPEE
jgi:Uma2 family endonuclease